MPRQGFAFVLWLTIALTRSNIAVSAQGTRPNFVQSIVPCPNSPGGNVSGYVTIEDMNKDMRQELDIIRMGNGDLAPYIFVLCPDTLFNVTTEPLLPLLSGAVFTCGLEGDPALNCLFVGGADQIVIENPADDVPNYNLESISFMGITFTSFTNAAITGTATVPTTVGLYNCNFDVR